MGPQEIQYCSLDSSNKVGPKDYKPAPSYDTIDTISTIIKYDKDSTGIGTPINNNRSQHDANSDNITVPPDVITLINADDDSVDGNILYSESYEVIEGDYRSVMKSFTVALLLDIVSDLWCGISVIISMQSMTFTIKCGVHLIYLGIQLIRLVNYAFNFIIAYIYPPIKLVLLWAVSLIWYRLTTIIGFIIGSIIALLTMLLSLTMITVALAYQIIQSLFVEPLVKSIIIDDEEMTSPDSVDQQLVSQDSQPLSDFSIFNGYMYSSMTSTATCNVKRTSNLPTLTSKDKRISGKTNTNNGGRRTLSDNQKKIIESHAKIEIAGLMVSVHDRIERLVQKHEYFQRTEEELSSLWSENKSSSYHSEQQQSMNEDLWQSRRSSTTSLANSMSQFSAVSEYH